MRVLIVDDSVVIRSAIRASLEGDARIEVVGSASNGKLAIDIIQQKQVDLMILDLEMPVLDGIQTLKAIRTLGSTVKVIVFSSLTTRGSEMALEALRNGAQDFVTKPKSESPEQAISQIRAELLPKVLQFLDRASPPTLSNTAKTGTNHTSYIKKQIDTFIPRVLVIASSTGGPSALETIFQGLSGSLKIPVFIAQHMPPVFTATFARRLSEISRLQFKEGAHGENVGNSAYIAPGDFHMTVQKDPSGVKIQLDKGPHRNSVRPAADPLFESVAKVYGASTLGIVLTGMGEDGLIGCRVLKQSSAGVVIQNQESCVVFGMPGAVFQEKLQDEIMSLKQIQSLIRRVALV